MTYLDLPLDPWTSAEIQQAQRRASVGHPLDPSVVQTPRSAPCAPWRPPTERWETKPADIYGWQNDKPHEVSVLLGRRHTLVLPGWWVRTDADAKPIEVMSAEEWAGRYRRPE